MEMTAAQLQGSPLEVLERVYREAPARRPAARRFGGEALCRVDTRFARSPAASALLFPFEHLSFWVDFVACTWAFVHPLVRMGSFRVDLGASRWRDTQTLRLRYDASRLPFRRILYDEVKPLSDDLCLGLGGIDFDRGTGDLFYFVLQPG